MPQAYRKALHTPDLGALSRGSKPRPTRGGLGLRRLGRPLTLRAVCLSVCPSVPVRHPSQREDSVALSHGPPHTKMDPMLFLYPPSRSTGNAVTPNSKPPVCCVSCSVV